ncbi:alpha/beta fold hydrolase [Pseudomonas aeruginosa]
MLHFLHGNGFCGRTYEPMLRLLAEDFDLWLCDIQGHGESDHGGRFHGWNRNAEMAVEAFEAGRGPYGDVQRLACGHSFGGVLSSLVLARHPTLFARAVLLDPVLFTPAMIGVMALSETLGLQLRGSLAKKAPAPQPVARSRSRLRRLARPRYLQGLDRRGAVGLRGICAEGERRRSRAEVPAKPRSGDLQLLPQAAVAVAGQDHHADPRALR